MVFEGFTSYYDDLLLRRAGLMDDAGYLKLLNKTINQVMQTQGARCSRWRRPLSDAWVKYYRQDENTPNATVSYTKGRARGPVFGPDAAGCRGRTTLDA